MPAVYRCLDDGPEFTSRAMSTCSHMHAKPDASRPDSYRHFETRQLQWQLEREHLLRQLTHEQNLRDKRLEQMRSDADTFSFKVASSWSVSDSIALARKVEQRAQGGQDSVMRRADNALHVAKIEVRRTVSDNMVAGQRTAIEAKTSSHDARFDAAQARRWDRGVEHARTELHLTEGGEREREQATRDFAAHKRADETHQKLSGIMRQQLPFGGPRNGTNTLGTGGQMQRESERRWREHRAKADERVRRASDRHLDRTTAVLARVSDMRGRSWRSKVDTDVSARRMLTTL